MWARLKLGDYIIDAAPGANTSTTSGLRLLLTGPRAEWSETSIGLEMALHVQVTGADIAEINARIEALTARDTRLVNDDVVLESEPGETLRAWRVSDNSFSRIRGDVASKVGTDPATGAPWGVATIGLRAERLGTAAGVPAGVLDSLVWEFGQEGNGAPSVSTRVPFATQAQAVAWVATMRAGQSGRPPWLEARFRGPFSRYEFEQQPVNTGGTVGPQHLTPCVVQLVYRALPDAWANAPAFADIQDCDVQWAKVARPPVDRDAGALPGHDVTAIGSFQFKTEVAGVFDAGDTAVTADTELRGKAEAAFAVLETQALAFWGTTWAQRRLQLTPDFRRGIVYFEFTALTGEQGRITAWDERLTITRTSRDGRVAGSKGDRKHPHRLGPRLVCSHDLTITALEPQEYPMPAFLQSPRWDEDFLTPGKPHFLDGESGISGVQQSWQGQWTLLSDGTEQPRQGASFAQLAAS